MDGSVEGHYITEGLTWTKVQTASYKILTRGYLYLYQGI